MNIEPWSQGRRGRFSRLPLVFLLLLALTRVSAQEQPCGYFELNGVPGYGIVDLYFTASHWRDTGEYPMVPDYNDDGIVSVLDLIGQVSCVEGLATGLVGRYYGFDNGDPDMVMTFPNFDSLTFEPTVVRAVERIEEFDNTDGFLNSDMVQRFGALFTGFLWVPESATYTLEISGREGMRVILDGSEILFFDGSPRADSTTISLDSGLHAIRMEYYSRTRNNTASLTWSSNGSIIGPTNQTITGEYLLHGDIPVPEHAVSGIQVVFDPPSGTRVDTDFPRVRAYVLSPRGNVELNLDNKTRVLYDGRMDEDVNLGNLGINPMPYTATDDAGNEVSGIYGVYYDSVRTRNNGLAANLYMKEWHEGAIPSFEGLESFGVHGHNGTQLERDGNGRLFIDGYHVSAHTIVELNGVIIITQPGEYGFRLSGYGALFINGEKVAARGYDYPSQFRDRSSLVLDEGAHRYRLIVSRPNSSPYANVYWTRPGASEEEIPPGTFKHDRLHRHFPPDFSTGNNSTGNRESDGLVAEYIFDPAAPWADTSGHGYDLMPDPRAVVRSSGGITYQTGGGTASLEAGTQLAASIVRDGNMTLEVDYIKGPLEFREHRLITLKSGSRMLAKIANNHDDLYFDFYDGDRVLTRLEVPNSQVEGNRYHVMGTFNNQVLKIYLNGVLMQTQTYSPDLSLWPNLASLAVGQGFYRTGDPGNSGNQELGTFLAAAAYARELGPPSAVANMDANRDINPSPGPLTHAAAPQFPPAGATASQLDEAHHILDRLAFGASPASMIEVLDIGVDAWIAQQLDPASIDDSETQTILNSEMFIPDRYWRDLAGAMIYRQTHSRRQLSEVMTQFWENHFNTEREKVNYLAEEYAENERFRDLALSTFGDLLLASASHYPMTVYLDSNSNVVGAPNENYAREILELHSYGVDNGYTQEDIEEAARCFTGWTVRNGQFYFNPGLHDYGEKTLLGITIPAGGGLSDGMTLIEHIVKSPRTAEFLSFKLCQLFIDDDPPADVQAAVATAFNDSCGDIKTVLQTLFAHTRFRTDTNYRNNKVKTPLEFGVSLLRATETSAIGNSLTHYLEDMGMDLFNFADPTGFAEEGLAWIDTNAMNLRWQLVNDVVTNRANARTPAVNIFALGDRYGFTDYVGILDFIEDLTTHGTEGAHVRPLAENWLTSGSPGTFTVNPTTLDNSIRQTLELYLRLPEFNKQ